jgi:predicted protein tyrosine phosphatase
MKSICIRVERRMPKVLFVCTANIQRSPTAADLFRNWNGVWETKSAGTDPFFGRNRLTQKLADWADIIVVMEPYHAGQLLTHFRLKPDKVKVVNIPDRYLRNDPELIRELKAKVVPILENWKHDSHSQVLE